MGNNLQNIAGAIADGVQGFAQSSAKAASRANGISAGAQAAQGAFNSQQAATANMIGTERLAEQYGFNSAQAAAANDFTQAMWDQTAAYNDAAWERAAAWNEMMWQKQADFNHAEAKLNRDWQEKMSNTSYQRAVEDMAKAGINPILASGGMGASVGSGSAASVGGTSMSQNAMSPMSGQAASGGLLNGINATESNYTGQMEYMGGMLGLMSAAIGGITSAMKYAGDGDRSIAKSLMDMLGEMTKENFENPNTKFNKAKRAIKQFVNPTTNPKSQKYSQ